VVRPRSRVDDTWRIVINSEVTSVNTLRRRRHLCIRQPATCQTKLEPTVAYRCTGWQQSIAPGNLSTRSIERVPGVHPDAILHLLWTVPSKW
jgi:hypothetical protein